MGFPLPLSRVGITAAILVAVVSCAESSTTTPADPIQPAATASVPPPSSVVTSEVTTTTNAEVALQAQLGGFVGSLRVLYWSATGVNESWDDGNATWEATHLTLESLVLDVDSFRDAVEAVPSEGQSEFGYTDLREEAVTIQAAARAMLAGLESPDDGTLRREALASFRVSSKQFVDAANAMVGNAHAFSPMTDSSDFAIGAGTTSSTTTTNPFQALLDDLLTNRNPPRYTAQQYGCHDDGRCLDVNNEWCDEGDFGYPEGYEDGVCDPWYYDENYEG